MNVGIELLNADGMTEGERDAAVAMATLDGVLRLLDEASREDDGQRYMALVNAAHDFGSAMFRQLRGCAEDTGVKPETIGLLAPLMQPSGALQ